MHSCLNAHVTASPLLSLQTTAHCKPSTGVHNTHYRARSYGPRRPPGANMPHTAPQQSRLRLLLVMHERMPRVECVLQTGTNRDHTPSAATTNDEVSLWSNACRACKSHSPQRQSTGMPLSGIGFACRCSQPIDFCIRQSSRKTSHTSAAWRC
jgi:hypothetical protein